VHNCEAGDEPQLDVCRSAVVADVVVSVPNEQPERDHTPVGVLVALVHVIVPPAQRSHDGGTVIVPAPGTASTVTTFCAWQPWLLV